jgi:ribosomal protein S18 acetylase RimI-like enzyme
VKPATAVAAIWRLACGRLTTMHIRPYSPRDWQRLCEIHDAARKFELEASGLIDAFLTLEQTAENEGLFDAEILVAEADNEVRGFAAYTQEELTWLYVDPRYYRQGIGRCLIRAVIKASPNPLSLEVLVGNDAALSLYRSEGFSVVEQVSGKLAGNESFAATAHVLKHLPRSLNK